MVVFTEMEHLGLAVQVVAVLEGTTLLVLMEQQILAAVVVVLEQETLVTVAVQAVQA